MDLQGENDVILTARHGQPAAWPRSTLWFTCVRLRWSPSLWWRAVFEVPRLTKSLGEELPCEWYAVAVQWCEGAPSSATVRKMSAARSLFLADQLLARYFSPISCLLAISGRSETVSACVRLRASLRVQRPHPHARRKYWRNLIWRCAHNPPNGQIKFPSKFSGHTVLRIQIGQKSMVCIKNS